MDIKATTFNKNKSAMKGVMQPCEKYSQNDRQYKNVRTNTRNRSNYTENIGTRFILHLNQRNQNQSSM